jgi:hypothetical protein
MDEERLIRLAREGDSDARAELLRLRERAGRMVRRSRLRIQLNSLFGGGWSGAQHSPFPGIMASMRDDHVSIIKHSWGIANEEHKIPYEDEREIGCDLNGKPMFAIAELETRGDPHGMCTLTIMQDFVDMSDVDWR